jgi:hypothetical protein
MSRRDCDILAMAEKIRFVGGPADGHVLEPIMPVGDSYELFGYTYRRTAETVDGCQVFRFESRKRAALLNRICRDKRMPEVDIDEEAPDGQPLNHLHTGDPT